MKHRIDLKDISFVVQGVIDSVNTPICLYSIKKYFPDSPIILSTWEGSDVSMFERKSVTIVLNKDPGGFEYERYDKKKIYNNVNRQIVSSYNGLKHVQTYYAIKIRSDMAVLSNRFVKYLFKFPKRSNEYRLFENRVILYCFTSKFQFKEEKTPFHISDWFYFGNTSDLIKLFDIPFYPDEDNLYFEKEYSKNTLKEYSNKPFRYHPEQYIGYKYFSKYFPEVCFEHRFCNDDKINDISNHFIANNFLILSHFQLSLYFLKKDRCEYFGQSYDYWKKTITFPEYEILYKKYCDEKYIRSFIRWYYKLIIRYIYKNNILNNIIKNYYKNKIK